VLCPSCGKEIAGVDTRCHSCGSLLTSAQAPSPEIIKQPSRRSGEATASLVLGLVPFILIAVAGVLSFVPGGEFLSNLFVLSIFWLPPVTGMLSISFGHQARGSIRRSAGRLHGGRFATAGLILGYLGLLGWIAMPKSTDWNGPASWNASAVISLRAINTAAKAYSAAYKRGFPPTLAVMGPPETEFLFFSAKKSEKAAGLIGRALASGTNPHYRFTYVAGPVDRTGKIVTYTAQADPTTLDRGLPHYFTDQSGVIRFEEKKEANQESPPLVGQ